MSRKEREAKKRAAAETQNTLVNLAKGALGHNTNRAGRAKASEELDRAVGKGRAAKLIEEEIRKAGGSPRRLPALRRKLRGD